LHIVILSAKSFDSCQYLLLVLKHRLDTIPRSFLFVSNFFDIYTSERETKALHHLVDGQNTKGRLYSMRNYENLVIVKPTLTAEEIQASITAIEEVITSNGGEIAARDTMGMRKLAYPINKNERGYFYVIYYSIAPSAISEIERRFRINENLLRFVTIKYDTNREVAAWKQLVLKANKKASSPAEETKTREIEIAPEVEEVAEETAE